MYNLATIMQGCTTYIQPSQGCVHRAKDDHKVVCTLQMLMQGCHKLAATLQGCNKLAARLPQPRNFHMGSYLPITDNVVPSMLADIITCSSVNIIILITNT